MDILICAKRTKIIASRTSSGLRIRQKCFGGQGSAPGPAGGACIAPRPLAGFWEGKMGKRKRGEEMSERRERGGGTKRRGRGIGGKEEEGTLLISFAPNLWTLATPLTASTKHWLLLDIPKVAYSEGSLTLALITLPTLPNLRNNEPSEYRPTIQNSIATVALTICHSHALRLQRLNGPNESFVHTCHQAARWLSRCLMLYCWIF